MVSLTPRRCTASRAQSCQPSAWIHPALLNASLPPARHEKGAGTYVPAPQPPVPRLTSRDKPSIFLVELGGIEPPTS